MEELKEEGGEDGGERGERMDELGGRRYEG